VRKCYSDPDFTFENGMTLVVIHTFTPTTPDSALIRIISARRATPRERKQYEEG